MDYRQRSTVMAVDGWAIPDNGLQTTVGAVAGGASQGLRRTTDNRQRTTEGGSRWSFAGIMELWNYG